MRCTIDKLPMHGTSVGFVISFSDRANHLVAPPADAFPKVVPPTLLLLWLATCFALQFSAELMCKRAISLATETSRIERVSFAKSAAAAAAAAAAFIQSINFELQLNQMRLMHVPQSSSDP